MKENETPRTGNKVRSFAAIGIVAALLVAASCDQGVAPRAGVGRVRIQLTDAPSDMLSSAQIWVSRVYLQGEGTDSTATDSAAVVTLFNDPANPKHYDLLTLRDSVSANLTQAVSVAATSYATLRIVVDSARVTLAAGYAFADGATSGALMVPSAAETGIKVQLDRPIETVADSTTTVVVDFNVDRNFVIQQNQDGTVRQIVFTPVLQEKLRERS